MAGNINLWSGYQSGGDWDWYYEAVTAAWPVVVKTIKDYLEKRRRKGTRGLFTPSRRGRDAKDPEVLTIYKPLFDS